MLSEAVVPILNDDQKMKGFWLNLGGEGSWNNSEEQRKIAQQALVDMARNSFGPKNDVLTIDVSLPKSDEEGDEDDTLVDYTDLVGSLIEKSKVEGTNIPQPRILRELAYDEIMSLNPGEFARSNDPRVVKGVGKGIAKTKKLLGYDPLYTWNPQQGGFWEEFPISNENLSSTGLNKLLITATPKSKKKKAYN